MTDEKDGPIQFERGGKLYNLIATRGGVMTHREAMPADLEAAGYIRRRTVDCCHGLKMHCLAPGVPGHEPLLQPNTVGVHEHETRLTAARQGGLGRAWVDCKERQPGPNLLVQFWINGWDLAGVGYRLAEQAGHEWEDRLRQGPYGYESHSDSAVVLWAPLLGAPK